MGTDTIELEPVAKEGIGRAWVLDDIAVEGNQVAGSVQAAGLTAECIKLSDLNERIHEVVSGTKTAPDVALIDLQWNIRNSSVQLGQTTIRIDDHSRFGLKIAEHLRGLEQFRRCTIVIATQYPDRDIGSALEELGMAVLIAKPRIRELPDLVRSSRGADSGRTALGRIGLKIHPKAASGANPKMLEGIARELGLEGDLWRLAGGTTRDVSIAQLLASTRDARERATMLRAVVSALHELYGRPLPGVDAIGRDLHIPFRSILLEGRQSDLQRILWKLQDRGGGGPNV